MHLRMDERGKNSGELKNEMDHDSAQSRKAVQDAVDHDTVVICVGGCGEGAPLPFTVFYV